MKNWNLEFKTTDNWEPLQGSCWGECPISILTSLDQKCRAKDLHDRHVGTICPIYYHAVNDSIKE